MKITTKLIAILLMSLIMACSGNTNPSSPVEDDSVYLDPVAVDGIPDGIVDTQPVQVIELDDGTNEELDLENSITVQSILEENDYYDYQHIDIKGLGVYVVISDDTTYTENNPLANKFISNTEDSVLYIFTLMYNEDILEYPSTDIITLDNIKIDTNRIVIKSIETIKTTNEFLETYKDTVCIIKDNNYR